MINNWLQLLFFFVLIIGLFFISRSTINEMFYFLRFFFRNEKFNFSLVSIFFLPGTIIHELSHFFAATVLMLKVVEVKIFPEFESNYIKLGRVLYQKKDFVRSLLVGIAPVFGGCLFLLMMALWQVFPANNFFISLLSAYAVFVVSSTMFSSKQDLIDLIYIIPLFIIIAGIIYIFNINLNIFFTNEKTVNLFSKIIKQINLYLIYSLAINFGLIIFFKSFRKIFKKR